jgi:UDP-N-acetylglucosamine diphosphorylase / glucose-1-phosphate thymidylyltransferase / UDP-N-acetylgalactosamine diphosphorylase / glucosamine-1-phosphate N-acetyltransferase / galactosamine-1-phosphate N-acetyltransferase
MSYTATDLFAPEYLAETTQLRHSSVSVNKPVSSRCVVLNSLISPREEVWASIELSLKGETGPVLYYSSDGQLVFGVLEEVSPEFLLGKSRKRKRPASQVRTKAIPPDIDSFCILRYPWELMIENSGAILQDYEIISPGDKNELSQRSDIEVKGKNLLVSDDADVGSYVTLDCRGGPIIVENAIIQSFSHLTGPCYVGKGTIVKSAKLREGTSIGSHCRVSGEIEETIMFDYSNKSHDGFIGHSVIGSWVNLGALTTNSDLKNTYGKISVTIDKKPVNTGAVKVGVFIGEMVKTAIGTLITSGRKMGVGSQLFGTVTEDVPSFTMYAKSLGSKSAEIYLDSAIETQKRVMERRGIQMSRADIDLLKSVFKMTASERTFQHVAKRTFKLG